MYDIFFVSKFNSQEFHKLKVRYPRARFLENINSFDDLKKRSFTKMFWVVWDDIVLSESFDLDSYRATEWDDMYVHVFKNGSHNDGLCLFPKNLDVSDREWKNRYFINKKETEIIASEPLRFKKYDLISYEQYEEIMEQSLDMFWGKWPDTEILDESVFNLYFNHHNSYDRNENHVFKNLSSGEESYKHGLVLFSKNKKISKREFDQQYLIDKKEHELVATQSAYPRYTINTFEEYQSLLNTVNEMFWCVWPNVNVIDQTIFNLYFEPSNGIHDHDRRENHVFKNFCNEKESYLNGIVLFSKHKPISRKEFERKYLIDKKEHTQVVSRFRYPKIKLDSYETYTNLLTQINSDLFWGVWPNIEITDETVFDFYYDPNDGRYDHDRRENHVFLNACGDKASYLNGIVLFSKHKPISRKEFERKYLIDKKEHTQVVSRFRYPKINLTDHDSYLQFLKNIDSDLFWGVWPNIEITDETVFDFYYDPNDGRYDHDRRENHVFLNACGDKASYLNGIVLFSKHKPISKKEFDRRYLIDKKEHDLAVSRFRYPKINLTDHDSYLQFLKNIDSDLFWGVWPNIEITDETVFDFYYDPNDGRYDHDRRENHVFLNACDQTQSFLSGIVLFSKHKPISNREFDVRYLIDKKEHDRVVSRFRYPRYQIDTYDDYDRIRNEVDSEMFWAIWPEIAIDDETIFDLYFDSKNGKYDFDRNINHVFKHKLRSDEESYNGLVLFSKQVPVSKKEIEYRYIIHKKEHIDIVSSHRPYDIIFISYNEPNAEDNWENLKSRFPRAKRIHGIKGIHNAHIAAANLAETDMFYVVDGDAVIEFDFDFSYTCSGYERKTVHVWRSRNPINNLEYGYGGIKLLPRNLTLAMNTESHDMTTSISEQFKVMPVVSNITAFNTDPFNTWRSAFRECVKLSSRTIRGQIDDETEKRLDAWCTIGEGVVYGEHAIAGALAGRTYGSNNVNNPDALKMINDFEWLRTQYGS